MGKRVIVTGASRGIGRAIAEVLAHKQYDLDLMVSSEASAEELQHADFVKDSGANVFAVDLASGDAIGQFVANWRASLWGIVNNAGICKTFGILDEGDDPLDEVLSTNLIGPYRLTKGLLPHLSRPGRIVNVASQLGQEGRAGYSAYCASKFGLIGMTKCWAKELGAAGVTVNAICPGWVGTEMSFKDVDRIAAEEGLSADEFYKDVCEPLELKRFTTPTEVANLVAFLISEEGSGVTGRDWLMHTVWNQC
ncbi:short-chain dehydrogenase [Burkholderia stagnalis]|uniref:SDR family NAD(P)-dependent oxidoreductase n=1 Tax=Burkholderia stagnalis TaxID=1503054 RepID=UPI0007529A82|nr:SDR family oxidoreductase [Burkholderia stagnalis]KVM97154.1 short-chain dehydrogenase [Burkholderia stagnalis]KVN15349.1 short-chain dehydrogenase [Burkholderia stagnalis]KWE12046.1 short-chain dehydrogenase [Burkholderia stagnalis]KWE20885.1 short-chain dehydrogenase [Burkholderia stagnalis]KWO72662.1 short-chain dehydrogenase [Burkholderia stagnalis]